MENQKCHLSLAERQIINKMRFDGKSLRTIAKEIGRNPTTVMRELNRNAPPPAMSRHMDCYERSKYAQDKSKERQRKKNRENRCILQTNHNLCSRVLLLLATGDSSPEEIAEIISRSDLGVKISGKTIRRFIKKFYPHYKKYFPHRGKRRTSLTPRTKRNKAKQAAPAKRSIHEKAQGKTLGDFELDMVVCSQSSSAILTIRELTTRKSWLRKVDNLKSETVRAAILRVLLTIPPMMRHNCIYDRGGEFAKVHDLEKLTGVLNYFCDAYCAWQKGSVEQANKEIRRYIPKGTDLATISEERLAEIELKLNSKLRPTLGGGLSSDDAWLIASRKQQYLLN